MFRLSRLSRPAVLAGLLAPAAWLPVADGPPGSDPGTGTMHVTWTVHVDPDPPWNASTATYEQGCGILDAMADVFEAHGLVMYVAVSWNFNDACQQNAPGNVLPGSVTDLAARGHAIGVHQHQGATLQEQVDGIVALTGSAPTAFDGLADYQELVDLGFEVGFGVGKDVSTQLVSLSTRSYRPDADDPFSEDVDGALLGFGGGSFEGQSYEPYETANMTEALEYDMARMVPGKLHAFGVTTHPDEFLGKSLPEVVADLALVDAWLTDVIDPLIADGSVAWTTKPGFVDVYEAWEAAGGDNDDLFPATSGQRKPGWSAWSGSDLGLGTEATAALDVDGAGTVSVGAGTITGGGLARDDGSGWAVETSAAGGLLSDKPLFLTSEPAGVLLASMATEPTLPGVLGLSVHDGAAWTHHPAPAFGFGGSPGFVWEAAVDDNGWTWVGTGAGVARLVGSTWTVFTPTSPPPTALSHNRVYRVAVGPDGRKWFGTLGGGIDVLDDRGTPVPFDDLWVNHDQPDLPAGTVRALAFDDAGDLWAGTQRGVARFDGATWTVYDETNSGLVHDHVTAIHVDHRGDLWFGTYGHGVSRYRPSTDLWDTFSAPGGELLGSHVLDVDEDDDGRLLFSGYHGGGVSVFEQRLTYDEPPRLGEDFELVVRGDAGDGVILLVSAATADLQTAAWGTLLVDPDLALLLDLPPVPATGALLVTAPIPNDPTLVGTPPAYLQAFTYASLGPAVGELTNRQSFVVLP